jgi:hypothetical protein
MSDDARDPDRPRGMLTQGDRKHILPSGDSGDIEPPRQRRYEMRKRVKNAVLDLTFMLEYLNDRDRQQIQEADPTDPLAFFMQRNIREILNAPVSAKKASTPTRDFYTQYFETVLAGGISRSIETEAPHMEFDVNVSLDISIKETAAPTPAEIETQIQSGEIAPEEIREFYDEGHLSLRALTQLTRNGRLFAKDELTDEAYQALLDEPVPILEDENADDDGE